MPEFAANDISIRSAACRFPAREASAEELFREEGAELGPEVADRLGIEAVRLCDAETGSELALEAAREAMELAAVGPSDLDLIVDFTILPQEYLVPAWSMGNKLQADLGAKKAFTLGFSGGGATNFQLCLSAAASLLAGDEGLDTALLVAADVTIPGNRVINPGHPITVLGDGASALVLQRGSEGDALLATRLRTEAELHDVYCIRGGAMRHPERTDLYRLELHAQRYAAAPRMEILRRLVEELLDEADIATERLDRCVYTNLSRQDRASFGAAMGVADGKLGAGGAARHGHIQGTDLVRNYLEALDDGVPDNGHLLVASHGMGYMYGASLIRHRK